MKRIKGYLAPSAPLNWELCDGTEEGVRPLVSFTTNWFYERAGAKFGERYHTDPYYRFAQIDKMQRYLAKTFPMIQSLFEHDPVQECATIMAIYASCPVSMIYGMKPVYQENDWPAIHPKDHFELEDLCDLAPFDLESNPFVENVLKQIETVEKEWGKCDGYLNYQGVLNTCYKLLGNDVMLYMITDPEKLQRVFNHVAQTTRDFIHLTQKAQRKTGFPDGEDAIFTCISNCVVNMISPDVYEEMLLPCDKLIAGSLDHTGVHTCNWVVDKVIDRLAKLDNLGYVDFSFHSDFEKVQSLLPNARKLVFYSPLELIHKTDDELRSDVRRVKDAFGCCDLCVADIDLNTPDEDVIRFVKITEEVSQER